MVLFWALDRFSSALPAAAGRVRHRVAVVHRAVPRLYGHLKDAVISIMATIAKQENIRRSERIKAGLAHAVAKGSRLGRPRVSDRKASRITLW
jgi:DNA invertase Pin-like site-specific DNA recombinase